MPEKNSKKVKLTWSMVGTLLLCWLLPLTILTGVTFFFVYAKINQQIERTIVTSTDKAVEMCQGQITDAVTASKNASYMTAIRDSYTKYQNGGSKTDLYEEVTLFLTQQYRYNKQFLCTVLYFTEDPETIYYTYSNTADATYKGIKEYRRVGFDAVREHAKEIDTDTILMNVDGHVYLVRNMMNASFEPYAVIVSEVDTGVMFGALESIWGYMDAAVYMDGDCLLSPRFSETRELIKQTEKNATMQNSVYGSLENEHYVYKTVKQDGHRMTVLAKLDGQAIVDELDAIRYIFILLIIFMIPLILVVFWFFHKKVTKPVNSLVKGAREIYEGNYGHQITELGNSEEFFYLGEAFNSMSLELKHQFEQIYLEELALRDANIMALQSQINPHFLNNTLEIINWEARLSDNRKVSAMIEALSTMLEATMNRKKQQMVYLSEELSYVDAYLYIISQRLGERFHFHKNVDERLLQTEVPRLIIQPIIENAVEHGMMNLSQEGTVSLFVHEDGEYLYIEVKDDGSLTEESKEKIEELLHGGGGGSSVSLGIRNVNERLKIIYGQDCGLTIWPDADGHTVSTLKLHVFHNDGSTNLNN